MSCAKTIGVGVFALALTGCAGLYENKVSVDYYSISGNSTAALDQEILRKGPRVAGGRHAVAVARIRIVPNVRYSQIAENCRVQYARVNVDAKVTLPRWTGRSTASEKLGRAWDNIDRYTRLHESVHVAIAFRFAREMEKGIVALPPQPSCSTLRRQVKQLVDIELERHDAEQKQFDADEQRRFSMLRKRKPKAA